MIQSAEKSDNVFIFPEKTRYKPETAVAYLPDAMPEHSESWLDDMRKQAMERVSHLGLPTPKLERWKYTDLPKALRKRSLKPGQIKWSISDADDFNLTRMPDDKRNIYTRSPFGTDKYNDTMLADLAAIRSVKLNGLFIEKGKTVDKPVDISVDGNGDHFNNGHFLLYLEKGAELTIIEKQNGQGAYWKNIYMQIVLEEGAILHHVKIQDDSIDSVNTTTTDIHIAEKAQYNAFTLTKGAGVSRNQIHAVIDGVNADCTLNGVNLLNQDQLGDTTITIEHKAPNCTSNQFYRSLLADKAHGVFQGKVHVYQEAQQTDGYQLSNTIMLSDGAEMDTKPELEIYADDVRCSHGATTGQLEDEPLFYMRARGISEKDAKRLLMQSFLAEVSEHVRDDDARADIDVAIDAWLSDNLQTT